MDQLLICPSAWPCSVINGLVGFAGKLYLAVITSVLDCITSKWQGLLSYHVIKKLQWCQFPR